MYITRKHKNWKIYNQYEQCGQIVAAKDGQNFALKCGFCDVICLQFEKLVKHIQVKHNAAVQQMHRATCAAEKNVNDEIVGKHEEMSLAEDLHHESFIEIKAERDFKQPLDVLSQNELLHENAVSHLEDDNLAKYERVFIKEDSSDTDAEVPDVAAASTYNSECEEDTDATMNSATEATNDSDLLHNYEALTYIIDAYEKQPILWDADHLEYKHNHKKRPILLKLADELKQFFNLAINSNEIRNQFASLRKIYRNELQKSMQLYDEGDKDNDVCETIEYVPKLWCFEKLQFLNERKLIIEETPTVIVTAEQLCNIAVIYESHPCLWQLDHEDNRNKLRKTEAIQMMLLQIEQRLNIKLTEKQLDGRLRRLKNFYARDKRKRLQAEAAGLAFKPATKYYEKLRYLEHTVGPYKCDHCTELINSYDKFRVHLAEHTGVKPFVCKICNKGLTTLGNLQIHMRRHTRETKFLCVDCGKGFPSSDDLNAHLNTHPESCNYVCELCGKAYSKKSFLKRHIEANHEPQNLRYKCTLCSKAYYKQWKYREHMNSHQNIRNCICTVCDKGFYSRKTLLQHKKTHAEKKDFSCKICGKEYARAASYHVHMKIKHSMDKDQYIVL